MKDLYLNNMDGISTMEIVLSMSLEEEIFRILDTNFQKLRNNTQKKLTKQQFEDALKENWGDFSPNGILKILENKQKKTSLDYVQKKKGEWKKKIIEKYFAEEDLTRKAAKLEEENKKLNQKIEQMEKDKEDNIKNPTFPEFSWLMNGLKDDAEKLSFELYSMAVKFYNIREYQQAKWLLLLSLQFKPDYIEVYPHLGLIYQVENNTEKRDECIEKAYRLNLDDKQLLFAHAYTMIDKGHLSEVQQDFRRYISKHKDVDVILEYASILEKNDNPYEAIEFLRIGKQESPQDPKVRIRLMKNLKQIYEFDKLSEEFKEYVKLFGRDNEILDYDIGREIQ